MSESFRDLLKIIGSGTHTGKDLTRQEAALAMKMMLDQTATPAQIGAFMISHRIKRPTPDELLGMMDTYDNYGWCLAPIAADYPTTVFNIPYDGRSRTAPIAPLTALLLAAAGCPVVMHGSDRMPTKYGVSLIDSWQAIGVDWAALPQPRNQAVFAATKIGFVYLPRDFPAAHALTPYRDQIGKRPPMATLEIMWPPYAGSAHVVSGFVHPPTEGRTQVAYEKRGESFYTTVKGLEGSTDLPRDRTAIIGKVDPDQPTFERLLLAAADYGLGGTDVPLLSAAEYRDQAQRTLAGESVPLAQSLLWNGGFYLWRCGVVDHLRAGLDQAAQLIQTGQVAQQLSHLQATIQSGQPATPEFSTP